MLAIWKGDPVELYLHLMNCLWTLMIPIWKNVAKKQTKLPLKEL